jgi:hypothetical protein
VPQAQAKIVIKKVNEEAKMMHSEHKNLKNVL